MDAVLSGHNNYINMQTYIPLHCILIIAEYLIQVLLIEIEKKTVKNLTLRERQTKQRHMFTHYFIQPIFSENRYMSDTVLYTKNVILKGHMQLFLFIQSGH